MDAVSEPTGEAAPAQHHLMHSSTNALDDPELDPFEQLEDEHIPDILPPEVDATAAVQPVAPPQVVAAAAEQPDAIAALVPVQLSWWSRVDDIIPLAR